MRPTPTYADLYRCALADIAARDAELAALRLRYREAIKSLEQVLAKFPDSNIMAGLEPLNASPGWLGRPYASDVVHSSVINEWRAVLSTPEAQAALQDGQS